MLIFCKNVKHTKPVIMHYKRDITRQTIVYHVYVCPQCGRIYHIKKN